MWHDFLQIDGFDASVTLSIKNTGPEDVNVQVTYSAVEGDLEAPQVSSKSDSVPTGIAKLKLSDRI